LSRKRYGLLWQGDVFQGLRDWVERLFILQELRASDRRANTAYARYFEDEMALAREALGRGDPEQASAILTNMRRRYPEIAETSRSVLNLLLDLGRYDEVETMMEKGRRKHPHYEHFARGRIQVAYRRGDLEEALRRCSSAHKKFPRMVEGYSIAAACLTHFGQHQEAEAIIARGTRVLPDEAELHIQHARNATERRQWPEALHRWEIVRSRFKDQFLGSMGAAQSLKEMGRFDEAEELLKGARERFYKVDWIAAEWADIAAVKGDIGEAIQRWRDLLARSPGFTVGYLKLTELLRRGDRKGEADELLDIAVTKVRSELSVHLEWARSAEWRQDFRTARKRWMLVRERFPNCPQAREQEVEALMDWPDGGGKPAKEVETNDE
jgi:tetratricopeptide (TPR) repeat protein